MSPEELNRYSRHLLLSEIGAQGQQKLKDASVLVIGAGGLGCPALQYLAAAGVGKIGIVDHDVVEESNLQRQILYNAEDVKQSKAIQARKRLLLLNPLIEVIPYEVRANRANILSLIEPYSIVVDGSDNFATRYLLNDACVILNKPLVFGSIFKFEGQVSVFNYKGGPTYRCLYPNPPKAGEVPNCSEVGVVGVLPGIIGVLQASEVIKIITGIGEVLTGKLLLFDLLTMNFSTITFSKNPVHDKIKELIDYDLFCGVIESGIEEISLEELSKRRQENRFLQLVDVRNEEEFERDNIGGFCIPLAELEQRIKELSMDKETVLVCQSGKRSLAGIQILKKYGFLRIFSLKGGISER